MRWKLFSLFFVLFLIACSNKEVPSGNETENWIRSDIPPELMIKLSDRELKPTLGSYSWSYQDKNTDEVINVITDIAPPPELVSEEGFRVTKDTEVQLLFDIQPIKYIVRVWDKKNNVIATHEEIEFATYDGYTIFEIEAEWKQGTASYPFSAFVSE